MRGMMALLLLTSPRHTLSAIGGRSAAGPSHSRPIAALEYLVAIGSQRTYQPPLNRGDERIQLGANHAVMSDGSRTKIRVMRETRLVIDYLLASRDSNQSLLYFDKAAGKRSFRRRDKPPKCPSCSKQRQKLTPISR